ARSAGSFPEVSRIGRPGEEGSARRVACAASEPGRDRGAGRALPTANEPVPTQIAIDSRAQSRQCPPPQTSFRRSIGAPEQTISAAKSSPSEQSIRTLFLSTQN